MMLIEPISFFGTFVGLAMAYGFFYGWRRAQAMRARAAAFALWWHNTGSGMAPLPGEGGEDHARRVAANAWDAGFAQRDAA